MLSAIIIRSIVAEFILTKILDTPLNIKEMVTELALVAIFIVCNTCFNTLTSAILYAVMEDIRPDAVKIGMINDVEIVEAIASCLRTYRPRFVVFDPVMVSTSGHRLIEEDAISALTRELMPLASLITPNLSEAEVLTEHCISNVDTMKAAASELLKFGCGSVLLKGGHLEGDKMCDVLQTAGEDKPHLFISDKIESKNTHGTGCTLSSAIATFLALGYDMPQAVEHAKAYVTKGIHAGKDVHIGEGHGPLNHFYAPVPMKTMK